ALYRADGPVRVGHGLTLGDLADQHLTVLGEGDDGRRGAGTFGVGDDCGLATLEHADHGVRRAEVDADRTCHVEFLHCLCTSDPFQVERAGLNVATPTGDVKAKLSLPRASFCSGSTNTDIQNAPVRIPPGGNAPARSADRIGYFF